jgi:hypothetical protein
MIYKFSQFINERLGVAKGNIESAETIYDEIIEFLSINSTESVKKEIKLKLKKELSIEDLIIDDISIHFQNEIVYEDVETEIIGMSVNSGFKLDKLKVVYTSDSIKKCQIYVKFLCNENKKYESILDYFKSEKSLTTGVLAHELKHVYDKYKIGKTTFAEAAEYHTISNSRLGIKAIDTFLFYIYLTSKQENLVRSTEVAAQLKTSNIKKSEFLEFLRSTSIFKRIIEMKKFSYEKMKIELSNDIDEIKNVLKSNNFDVPENDKEIVEYILEVTYRYIVGSQIDKLSNMININPFTQLLGIIKEEEIDYFNKFIKRVNFKNHEDFFLFWEKRIIFESNKVMKKISKLYDMCEND